MVRLKNTPIITNPNETSKNWIFERYNSKYNRIWGQMNDFGLLMAQVAAGYIFALMAIENLPIDKFVYSFFFVALIILFLSILLGRLELERLRTKYLLNEFITKNI